MFHSNGAVKLIRKGYFEIVWAIKIGKKNNIQSNYFVDYSLKIENDLWYIRNLEEVTEKVKKMFCFKKISLGCQKIIF